MKNYNKEPGMLYVVATPIGNLADITFRAIDTFRLVDLIVCEDTRRTRILLDHYNIKKTTISYHQHSKLTKIDYIINEILQGKNIALVTDAGTPNINDPGGVLVSKAIENNIKTIPIPGVSAITTLLSVSGLASDNFLFLGFLPKKKGRQTLFRNLMKTGGLDLYNLILLYESPNRVVDTLRELQLVIGNYEVVIGRELTKLYEEVFRGSISDAISYFSEKPPKGEFVIAIKTKKCKNN